MQIQVRYFAAAKAATGRAEEARSLPGGATVGALVEAVLAELGAAPGTETARVFGRCSYIVNGAATTDRALPLADGDRVDVLPPFAGG